MYLRRHVHGVASLAAEDESKLRRAHERLPQLPSHLRTHLSSTSLSLSLSLSLTLLTFALTLPPEPRHDLCPTTQSVLAGCPL